MRDLRAEDPASPICQSCSEARCPCQTDSHNAPVHAELAYLFRHGLLRDAAYVLHLPAERRRLHGLALDIMEQMFAADPAALDTMAGELAAHAGAATQDPAGPEGARECTWLERAGAHAHDLWHSQQAADYFGRVAVHPAADPPRRAQARLQQGKALLDQGNLQAATKSLEQARAHPATEEQALRPLSYAYRNLGRAHEALEVAERLMQLAAPDTMSHAMALDARATALTGLERYEEALPDARRAVEVIKGCGQQRLHGGLVANLGVLQGRLRLQQESLATLRLALQLLETTDDRRATAAARRNLADRLRTMSRYKEAEEQCLQALSEMRAVGDRRGEGMALMTLGGLQDDTGDTPASLRTLALAAPLLLESGDLRAAAIAIANTAKALLGQQQVAECRETAGRALALAQSSGSAQGCAYASVLLGDAAAALNDWAEAARRYADAGQHYTRLKDAEKAAWYRAEAAVALRRAGDTTAAGEYALALQALQSDAPADLEYYERKWSES